MGDKEEKYAVAERQIRSIVSGETDVTANMSNVAAVLHMTFGFWWTGFYRVSGDELVLGPFQGPVACTRIGFGRGVCGTAWKEAKTVIVPDVEKFPGHIACSSLSRSEIVIPIIYNKVIKGVLDIDSDRPDDFDDTDREGLEQLVRLMAETLYA